MRDWRTHKQITEDKRSRRQLKLEAWSIGLVMAIIGLTMLAALTS